MPPPLAPVTYRVPDPLFLNFLLLFSFLRALRARGLVMARLDSRHSQAIQLQWHAGEIRYHLVSTVRLCMSISPEAKTAKPRQKKEKDSDIEFVVTLYFSVLFSQIIKLDMATVWSKEYT